MQFVGEVSRIPSWSYVDSAPDERPEGLSLSSSARVDFARSSSRAVTA